MMRRLSSAKKEYLVQLILLLGAAELAVLIFPDRQVLILFLVAAGFLLGFLLRIFQIYTGRRKPPVVDLSSFCLALILSAFATGFHPSNAVIPVLLPFLAVPNLIYIFTHHR
jgi:hypothetical protein